jgi:DNA repair protein RadC
LSDRRHLKADIETTREVAKAASLFGLTLHDHSS